MIMKEINNNMDYIGSKIMDSLDRRNMKLIIFIMIRTHFMPKLLTSISILTRFKIKIIRIALIGNQLWEILLRPIKFPKNRTNPSHIWIGNIIEIIKKSSWQLKENKWIRNKNKKWNLRKKNWMDCCGKSTRGEWTTFQKILGQWFLTEYTIKWMKEKEGNWLQLCFR